MTVAKPFFAPWLLDARPAPQLERAFGAADALCTKGVLIRMLLHAKGRPSAVQGVVDTFSWIATKVDTGRFPALRMKRGVFGLPETGAGLTPELVVLRIDALANWRQPGAAYFDWAGLGAASTAARALKAVDVEAALPNEILAQIGKYCLASTLHEFQDGSVWNEGPACDYFETLPQELSIPLATLLKEGAGMITVFTLENFVEYEGWIGRVDLFDAAKHAAGRPDVAEAVLAPLRALTKTHDGERLTAAAAVNVGGECVCWHVRGNVIDALGLTHRELVEEVAGGDLYATSLSIGEFGTWLAEELCQSSVAASWPKILLDLSNAVCDFYDYGCYDNAL